MCGSHTVWFAWEQQPWIGQVLVVDPSVSRPIQIQVHCYTPVKGVEDLTKEQFLSTFEEDRPVIIQMSTHQVLLSVEKLTPRDYLPAKARRHLPKMLKE